MNNKEIIKLSKISKKYIGGDKDVVVLKNVNLKINKGELISLTGPSGSGKSTLLHIIALLDQPTSGEVFFKKKSFSKSKDVERDSGVGDVATRIHETLGIPAGRQGTPEEIASLAVYLSSELAGYITGQCYLANGGAYFQ